MYSEVDDHSAVVEGNYVAEGSWFVMEQALDLRLYEELHLLGDRIAEQQVLEGLTEAVAVVAPQQHRRVLAHCGEVGEGILEES